MKNIALTLTVLATVSLVSQAALPHYVQATDIAPEDVLVDEVVQAARGFFTGFQAGLYKTDSVDPNCLNKDAEMKIIEIFDAVFQGKLDLSFIMRLVTDLMSISSSLQSCGTKPFTDLANFCLFDPAQNCAPGKVLDNVQRNMLLLLSKLTDISTLVMEGIPKDAAMAFEMGQQAGKDVGGLLRMIINFSV